MHEVIHATIQAAVYICSRLALRCLACFLCQFHVQFEIFQTLALSGLLPMCQFHVQFEI